MFRRIELITKIGKMEFKQGLCGFCEEAVADAWADDMPGPKKKLHKNCRFFFTELGWDEFGRNIVAACISSGQRYRVISVKERSVDVMYGDKYQVAVRPLKRRDNAPR